MKKLTVLMVIMLVAGLLTGCWLSNQAPIITSDPIIILNHGEYVYDVEAEDPDGDILTYSLAVSPDGMTIDPETGVIRWQPNGENTWGAHQVIVEVSDGREIAIQSFILWSNM